MSLIATDKGGDFVQIPAGTSYVAICYRIVDLGTQQPNNPKYKAKQKVWISWEFPTEIIEEGEAQGKPFIITKFYTLSTNEQASLRKDLESWRGRAFTEAEIKAFDLRKILGVPCMIAIKADEEGKSVIGSISPLPKGFVVPPPINPQVAFDITNWDSQVFDSLPDGIKAMILQSDEVRSDLKRDTKGGGDGTAGTRNTEDIPF